MIPRDYITEWRNRAPWVEDFQVEQDLVISRALVEIFSDPFLNEHLAFRGGTALYKLYLHPPARYSEDIDLVQVEQASIGPVLDRLRRVLNPWLGEASWKQSAGRVTLNYRFTSEGDPSIPLRLKIEINSREHFTLFGYLSKQFAVESRWFQGSTTVKTFELDELLGTKMRALYQRKKGRDLFDLATALRNTMASPATIVQSFQAYMDHEEAQITRAVFERNLADKLASPRFADDIMPLLAHRHDWDMHDSARIVLDELVARLPGQPWKGTAD